MHGKHEHEGRWRRHGGSTINNNNIYTENTFYAKHQTFVVNEFELAVSSLSSLAMAPFSSTKPSSQTTTIIVIVIAVIIDSTHIHWHGASIAIASEVCGSLWWCVRVLESIISVLNFNTYNQQNMYFVWYIVLLVRCLQTDDRHIWHKRTYKYIRRHCQTPL